MIFDSSLIQDELSQLKLSMSRLKAFQNDLILLVEVGQEGDLELSTSRFQLELAQFKSSLRRLVLRKEILLKSYTRQKILFDQQVIASSEIEKDKVEYELAIAEIDYLKNQNSNKWKQELLSIEKEHEQLLLKFKDLINELNKYKLLAPVKGEVQNVTYLRMGQFVQEGLKLGEISPDTTLLAICWVSPNDIGLIHQEMEASIRITAFNSNEWGFLKGRVIDISSDVYVINNEPYFKVVCKLEKQYLKLRNGFVGKLKKGMVFQANFVVTRRTLYQLLYDKIDMWLNPNIISKIFWIGLQKENWITK